MSSLIAIHGSGGYVPRWKEAALARGYEVLEVDGFRSDILERLSGCTALLWHLDHENTADLAFARNVLFSAEKVGLQVYPNHESSWHFDDKIAQKYLLEAVGAPLAQTWVFYSRQAAIEFLSGATYPLVFKLRRGAGSLNVQLVRNRSDGERLVSHMFGRGMSPFPAGGRLIRAAERGRARLRKRDSIGRRAVRVASNIYRQAFRTPKERDYIFFQAFVPGNDHDLRVTVIGDRCFVFRRDVRPNDFRASGSGQISYFGKGQVPADVVEIAFSISRRLGFQSMAYDFVREPESCTPVLLEISYSFDAAAIAGCPGHISGYQGWRDGAVWPQDAIVDDLLS